MHKLAPALSVNIFNFVHKNYRIYLINFKTLWCTVFNIGLFCCMCCIVFKNWTKLGPLLQVAKLSVYNLSNKQVFYSGMVCVVFASGNVNEHQKKKVYKSVQFTHCTYLKELHLLLWWISFVFSLHMSADLLKPSLTVCIIVSSVTVCWQCSWGVVIL